ncbi:MAG: hypothetical protein WD098_01500 [Balneolales bacterium]
MWKRSTWPKPSARSAVDIRDSDCWAVNDFGKDRVTNNITIAVKVSMPANETGLAIRKKDEGITKLIPKVVANLWEI